MTVRREANGISKEIQKSGGWAGSCNARRGDSFFVLREKIPDSLTYHDWFGIEWFRLPLFFVLTFLLLSQPDYYLYTYIDKVW